MDSAYKLNFKSKVMGILFLNSSFNYALRFPVVSLPDSSSIDYSLTSCRDENFFGYNCQANRYLESAFISLQYLTDATIFQKYNESFQPSNVVFQRMPRRGAIHIPDGFTITASLYFVFALLPIMIILLVEVVEEKEKKIKEGMKVMGLSNIALWLGWALTYGAIIVFISAVLSIISVYGTLFERSNFILILMLILLFSFSIEMMGFMLTPFFNDSKAAAAAGSFFVIFLQLLYVLVFVIDIPKRALWAINLLSPTGFAIAITQLILMDTSGVAADFSSLWYGKYPLGVTLIMMVVDIFLYFLLTLYFDNVVPSEYGQHKPLYFFLIPSYWFPKKRSLHASSLNQQALPSSSDFELPSSDLLDKEAIRFHQITKNYKSGCFLSPNRKSVTAVNNFSLDIYEGQITALLGHNGAGKTTLFNILTGFIEATAGTASVFNYDISNSHDLEKVHQMTGFCPQHDILFDMLSVREHLVIFAGIKGISDDKASAEIKRIIELLGLNEQEHTLAKNLSGGQKRKLSVGIAIIGDPKVLILDEPTAGMDPYSRHILWNVLRERKGSCVTLLTTHFMDEADILADRKAIISQGKLRCVGSSLFLKNRFGIGYHLGIVTKKINDNKLLTNFISNTILDSELQRAFGYELGYTLPLSGVNKFPELFDEFEKRGDELNVQSYGISMTTLEEVFLKIGEEDEFASRQINVATDMIASNNDIANQIRSFTSRDQISAENKHSAHDNHIGSGEGQRRKFNPAVGKVQRAQFWDIFVAIFRIKFFNNIRNSEFVFMGFIVPFFMAFGGVAIFSSSSSSAAVSDPSLVNVSAGAFPIYLPLLYKNSSGEAIDDFVTNSPVALKESDLDDFLNSSNVSYLATDMFQYRPLNVTYKALYNTSGIHSLPSIVNAISQSVLKSINSSAPPIHAFSKSWPTVEKIRRFDGSIYGGVLISAFSVLLTSGAAMVTLVLEREFKIRNQLRVTGVSFNIYWSAHLLGDFLIYLIASVGFFIAVFVFKVDAFLTSGAISALFDNWQWSTHINAIRKLRENVDNSALNSAESYQIFVFIGAGASSILASYCFSFIYNKHQTVSSTWFNVIQILSFLPFTIVSTLDGFGFENLATTFNVIFVLFLPQYTLFSVIYYLLKVYGKALYYEGDLNTFLSANVYFDWSEPMIPLSILMCYLHLPFFWVLLQVIEVAHGGGKVSDIFGRSSRYGHVSPVQSSREREVADLMMEEDDDVGKERVRVNEIVSGKNLEKPVIMTQNLRKEFLKRTGGGCHPLKGKAAEEKVKVAVSDLSLAVSPGEVLGLLGPNGAGKTTALSILIADQGPTKGQVFISGYDIQSNQSEAFRNMGYCPQGNPIWDLITIKEHLEVYAKARGVNEECIKQTVDNYVDALDIREHLNKRGKELSGGTKRKLCFAIAMLGNPLVVLLDEPSTGMDPKTKRFLWDTISNALEGSSRGAVLTTHYMDEADALCSRVAIMVMGKLRCLGSTQHLKNKFGQGYILEIKLKANQNDREELDQFVAMLFSTPLEAEQFNHRYVYKITQDNVTSLSEVFKELELAKQRIGIEEYSFSQCTLEQVFLQFAKDQVDEENQI